MIALGVGVILSLLGTLFLKVRVIAFMLTLSPWSGMIPGYLPSLVSSLIQQTSAQPSQPKLVNDPIHSRSSIWNFDALFATFSLDVIKEIKKIHSPLALPKTLFWSPPSQGFFLQNCLFNWQNQQIFKSPHSLSFN